MADYKELQIVQGKTFAYTIQWETEEIAYVPIATVTNTAPVEIETATPHNLPDGWNVAVTNCLGMTQINAEANNIKGKDYRPCKKMTATRISINAINAKGFKAHTANTGVLQYNVPQSLTGYTARCQFKDKVGGTVLKSLTTENGGITIDTTKSTITLVITAADTAAMNWKSGVFELEMVSSTGVVDALIYGKVTVAKEVTT